MKPLNIKSSETLYRRIVETSDRVFTLSILKYPVNKDSFYYTMRVFELERFDDFEQMSQATTVIHEKSVFGKSCKSLPSLSEMVLKLEAWFASDFLQASLSFGSDIAKD